MTEAQIAEATRCPHCRCRFDYHEVGCPALVDDIVESVVSGFAEDVERIMADHPETKAGDMTTEQQCQMVAEASGWRERALKAEAALEAARIPAPAPDDPLWGELNEWGGWKLVVAAPADDVVERVARAICDHTGELSRFDTVDDHNREYWLGHARAALSAIPIPAPTGEVERLRSELTYHASQARAYVAQPSATMAQVVSARHHIDRILAALTDHTTKDDE